MKNNKGGRPSLPDTIKKLSGTLRKDRSREGIDYARITEVPKPEVWLSPRAKIYFKNGCELLINKKLLNEANVQLVLLMAEEFATYEEATRELKKGGKVFENDKGDQKPSPWIMIRNISQKNYRDIASLFGLDPLSQQKIGPAKGEEKDPFEETQKKYAK